MGILEPRDLVFEFSMRRLSPEVRHDIPEEYPQHWRVTVAGTQFDEEDSDTEEVPVGSAAAYVIPDAADQPDIFMALDPHSQELAELGEMLRQVRPDLIEALDMSWAGDLLYLSYVELEEVHRGHGLGQAVLDGILDGIGRYTGLVVLQAAPVLGDGAPEEGSLLHRSAKRSLARYWSKAGFETAAGDWMYKLV